MPHTTCTLFCNGFINVSIDDKIFSRQQGRYTTLAYRVTFGICKHFCPSVTQGWKNQNFPASQSLFPCKRNHIFLSTSARYDTIPETMFWSPSLLCKIVTLEKSKINSAANRRTHHHNDVLSIDGAIYHDCMIFDIVYIGSKSKWRLESETE